MIHVTHSKHTVFLTKTKNLILFKDIIYVYSEKSIKISNVVFVLNLKCVCGYSFVCLCFEWPDISNVHQNKRDVAEKWGQVESRCECGDKTSGSIKCGIFLTG